MDPGYILRLTLAVLVVLGLLATIGYGFYRLITKTQTSDVEMISSKQQNVTTSENAMMNSAQVETPSNYEFMFDDCPNTTGLMFTEMASMSVQECANKCSEMSGCGAFYSTGCSTSKTCDGLCTLVSKELKNIIPKSEIGRGLCTVSEEGDIKLYRKLA